MNALDHDPETVQSFAYNPFPEPQTIPTGWDTSAIFATAQPASEEGVDDLPENETT